MIILNNKSEFANIFYSALEETYSIIENSDRTEDIQKAGYALIFLADIAMDYSIVFPYEDFLYSYLKYSNYEPTTRLREKVYSDLSLAIYLLNSVTYLQSESLRYGLKNDLLAIVRAVEPPEKKLERIIRRYKEKVKKEERERQRQIVLKKMLSRVNALKKDNDYNGLLDMIDSTKETEIQISVINAVGEIRNPESADKLFKYLKNPGLQKYVISALIAIGNENAVNGLIAYAKRTQNYKKIGIAFRSMGSLSRIVLQKRLRNPEDIADLRSTLKIYRVVDPTPLNEYSLTAVNTFIAEPSFAGFFNLSLKDWVVAILQSRGYSIHDAIVRTFVVIWIVLPFIMLIAILIFVRRKWIWPKLKISILPGDQKEININFSNEHKSDSTKNLATQGEGNFYEKNSYLLEQLLKNNNSLLNKLKDPIFIPSEELDAKPFIAWARSRWGKAVRIRFLTFITDSGIQTGILDAGKNIHKGKYIIKLPNGNSMKIKVT